MQTGRQFVDRGLPARIGRGEWTHVAAETVDRLLGERARSFLGRRSRVNVIDLRLALTAYRVVVEAIRNAVRHGKASRVVVIARA